MYQLEYAQFHRGEFRAWIEAGSFATKTKVLACIAAHGAGEYLVSKAGKSTIIKRGTSR